MWNNFKVIDADAHHHEPQYLWDRYLDPAFQDKLPKVIGMRRNFFAYDPNHPLSEVVGGGGNIPPEHDKYMADKYGEAYDQWWSPEIRLRDMDKYGWDIQVILSTNGNRIMDVSCQYPELGLAMSRAYHNWCRDYASADPSRIKFTATPATGDTPSMVEEVRRAVEELGAVSTRNPLLPEGKWIHQPEYDALWQLACDLDFPISLHGEWRARRASPLSAVPRDDGHFAGAVNHIMAFPMDNMTTLAHFIFSGILDRFPKLRLGVLEANVGWAQFFLPRMDSHSHGRHAILGHTIPRKPSEYVLEQCILSADPDEPALPRTIEFMGDDNFVWNTDYPHPDAPDPDKVMPWFQAQPISDESKRKILWDNAVRLYGPRLLESAP